MAGLIARIRKLNKLEEISIAEPFAGGAGASLSLLMAGQTNEVFINDADPAIYAFWWSVINRIDDLTNLISEKRISMAEWQRQRAIYRSKRPISKLRRGFAAFYLNRCNRSGIICNGGPIGGIDQQGPWKLGARYNKRELIKRCEKVANIARQIRLSSEDGIEFIEQAERGSTFLFIDPPYFRRGKTLYLNSLDAEYHVDLADKLRRLRSANWILTYDDCPEIRRMYRDWARVRPFSLRYVASQRLLVIMD